MPDIPLEHAEGCTPASPCASCRIMALLRSSLSPEIFRQVHELFHQAYGRTYKGSPLLKSVKPETPWRDVFSKRSMPVRVSNALINAGYITIGDITSKTGNQLMRMPNFGRHSLALLKGILLAHGLEITPEP